MDGVEWVLVIQCIGAPVQATKLQGLKLVFVCRISFLSCERTMINEKVECVGGGGGGSGSENFVSTQTDESDKIQWR